MFPVTPQRHDRKARAGSGVTIPDGAEGEFLGYTAAGALAGVTSGAAFEHLTTGDPVSGETYSTAEV